MKRRTEIERLIAGRLFGDLSVEEDHRLDALIARGDVDVAEIDAMEETLSITSVRERESADPAFMTGLHARIVEKAAAEAASGFRPRFVALVEELAGYVVPRRRWATHGALVVAALVIGVVLGRSMVGGDADTPETVTVATQAGQPGLESAADKTSDYIGRSKILLLGIVNDDLTDDFTRHREVAGDLVSTAGQLQTELDADGNRRLSELVSEIEMIMLQIANLEGAGDQPAVEMIRHGVDQKALLLRINMEELNRGDTPESGAPMAPTKMIL